MPVGTTTPRYFFPKPYSDFVQSLRVPAGFLLLITFAWLSRPSYFSLVVGLPLSCAGLALRGWAAGHLAKDRELAISGPYSLVRNPLYLGTALTAFGLAIAARSVWLDATFAGVFLLVYLPVIELEEQHLRELFPDYDAYAARVNRLWPLGGKGSVKARDFSWNLFRRNEEFKAALGWLTAVAWLWWRLPIR